MLFSTVKQQVMQDPLLHKQVQTLYQYYAQHGTTLPTGAMDAEWQALADSPHQLIRYQADESNWRIQPTYWFAYSLLVNRIDELERTIPVTLEALDAWFEQATWQPDTVAWMGVDGIRDRVMELVLTHIHERTGQDFATWIPRLTEEPFYRIKFEFLQAYCVVADQLPLPSQPIVEACQYFLTWQDWSVDHSVSPLLVRLGTNRLEEAIDLIQTLPEAYRPIRSGLMVGVIQGNVHRGWPLFCQLFPDAPSQAFLLSAAHALPVTMANSQDVLDVLLTYDRTIELNRCNLAIALARLLNQLEFEAPLFVERCFTELQTLARTNQLQTAQCVLHALHQTARKYPQNTLESLLILVDNEVITHEQIGKMNALISFDSVLSTIDAVELHFLFFETYARRFATSFRHDTFYRTITKTFRDPETNEVMRKKVLDCLVHDDGEIRLFGQGLLDCFVHYRLPFSFHQAITQLPAITQYKLMMSILVPYKSPEQTLPLLLPLLKSDEPIVAEVFLHKLEELSEGYHTNVIELVEAFVQEHDPPNARLTAALTRLKGHYALFCQQLAEKRTIAEFHPQLTQTALYQRFTELHRFKMNEQMHRYMDNREGFLSHFKTVVLAKGGGWKHTNRDEVSKLGEYQTSYTWPRLHLLNPEKFDLTFRLHRAASWASEKTDFMEWITESSSGNI